MKINLGEVLSKAWQITWKFKVLWIFGILAGCGGNSYRFNSSGGGGNGGGGSGGNGGFNGQNLPEPFRQFANMNPDEAFRQFTQQYMGIIVAIICVMCILWLLFIFLGIMGKTGLIRGASQADAGATSLSFGGVWSESTPYFWRMLGLRLLVGVPIFLLVIIMLVVFGVMGYSAYKGGVAGGGLAAIFIGLGGIFVGFMCLLGFLGLVIGMVVEQAENAIVLEDLSVLPALSRGWNVFKSAVLTVILLALMLGLVEWVVSLILAVPMIAILLPVGVSVFLTGGQSVALPLILAGGCCLLYLPVLLAASGILRTYSQSVWTLAYRRLTAPVVETPAPPAPAQPSI